MNPRGAWAAGPEWGLRINRASRVWKLEDRQDFYKHSTSLLTWKPGLLVLHLPLSEGRGRVLPFPAIWDSLSTASGSGLEAHHN